MTGPTTEALAPPLVKAARRSLLSLALEGFRDIVQRQRLIRYLVGADLKRTHVDTLFGQLWWIFDPLLQMAVYYVLVSFISTRQIPDYALFLFAAVLPWKWFATTVNDATMSVVNRQSLIRQIQFPKVVLPTAAVVAGTLSFMIGLIALGIVYLFFLDRLSPWVLLLPVVAAVQFVFTLALAIALSACNAFYRDVQNVMRHIVRLWFYLSPGLYSLDHIGHGTARTILSLNPFAPLFESYRAITWGMGPPQWLGLLWVLALSVLLLILALALFKRVEPAFARIL
ncbi:MAG TPA: ABC transporter permease [Candidatus Limnocylindrales bacterium]|jgi:lipopolysaccharide transport system permease protein/teichoic acid transport system permease protein